MKAVATGSQTGKTPKQWAKQLALFGAGTILYGFAVGLMAAPNVGVSPVSSIAYALTYILPGMTLGMTQMAVNTLMVIIQILWLRKEFPLSQLLQIPASLAFSVVIDAAMPLVNWLMGLGSGVAFRGFIFLCSLPVMALGLALLLQANLVMMPGDGLAKTLAQKKDCGFGRAKVSTDCACVCLTCALCLMFLDRIVGIQIGTVVAALTLGRLVKIMTQSKVWCRLIAKEKED